MQLYHGMSAEFIDDAVQERIAGKLADTFEQQYQYKPPQSEVRSWQNSLRAMAWALQTGSFDDHGVVLEWQLPLTSRRLDVLVTGKDPATRRANAVIVELKQWDDIERSNVDDCVVTFVGGAKRDVLHPSRQVGNYRQYLRDVHTSFSEDSVGLHACSYLHNLRYDALGEVFDDRHRAILDDNPAFAGDQTDHLVGFLERNLGAGEGEPVLEEVLIGKYRPHKRLLDHTAQVIRNEPTYVLLDEQQVIFNTILTRVRAHQLGTSKSVFLVHGGPGTGKSVLAVNLLAELGAQGYVTQHATGSKAFTENLRKTVGARAGAMFGYFNGFATAEENQFDVLVLDEAHRIRDNSASRFTPKAKRSDKPQIDELVHAAKTTVFFIDDMQVVRPGEVGSSDLIREATVRAGANLVEMELETQFRCNGSDRYIRWVDTLLDLRRTTHVLWDPTDPFEFDVVDSPEELEAIVRSRAAEGLTARLSAGFCWPWSKPRTDGTLVDDVVVGGWLMPWNAKPDAGRLAAGIPKSNFWASDPGGINQVGCVYTAQGFEYDMAGVIWGRDLVYRPRDGGWVGQPEFSKDSVVRRARGVGEFTQLVKQTYRVLLTRGLQSCAVFFEDEQTRDYVLSRIDRARH